MPIEATITTAAQATQTVLATQLINETATTLSQTAQSVAQSATPTALPIEVTVTIVGVSTVFLVFVILYAIFKLMEIFGTGKNKRIKTTSSKITREVMKQQNTGLMQSVAKKQVQEVMPMGVDEAEEIAAVFAAIYAMMGTNIKIKSISRASPSVARTKGQRGWEEWRTYGWRGGNRW
ncbi:OadG family protein [Fervidobacterium sp.]